MNGHESDYLAGNCNIGSKEVAVRWKLFRYSFLLTLVLTVFFLWWERNNWMLLIVYLSSFVTILLYIEIKKKFCILFGLFNLYNFGPLGNLDHISDPVCSEKDRQKALRIILFALLVASPYALGICFLCWKRLI